jgi:hypothetical protein
LSSQKSAIMKKQYFKKIILLAGLTLIIITIRFSMLPFENSDITFKTSFDLLKDVGVLVIQCKSIF